jgi:hypothetical protein
MRAHAHVEDHIGRLEDSGGNRFRGGSAGTAA